MQLHSAQIPRKARSVIRTQQLILTGLLILLCPGRSMANAPVQPVTEAYLDPGSLIYGIYPAKRACTESDVRGKIDALHSLGVQTIVITYPEYILNTWGAFYDSSLPELTAFPNPLGFDLIETVMTQADKNGQSVMLGTGRGKDALLTYDRCADPERLEASLSLTRKVVRELHSSYAMRHESFAGCYLSLECRDVGYASAYYDPIADLCHSLVPAGPVMIAPDGSPVADSQVIAASHADIFSYQDAVGAGFLPAPEEKYAYDPEPRIATLEKLYATYAAWHRDTPQKQIWAGIELWQMDGPEYTAAYPAEWSRVRRQLEAVRPHVSQVIFYECGGFLESPDSQLELGGPRAVRLFEEYESAITTASP